MKAKKRGGKKCKIKIEYIRDDKKRADALYKRRRGLIKKAYELSVICGLKISVFGTDFNRSCFSFCNDRKLKVEPEEVFSDFGMPIWMTNFSELDYPYSLVGIESKQRLVYGKPVVENGSLSESFQEFQQKLASSEDILSKRDSSSVYSHKNKAAGGVIENLSSFMTTDRLKKKLKIEEGLVNNDAKDGPEKLREHLKIEQIEIQGPQISNTPYLGLKQDLFNERITLKNLDSKMTFSMERIIEEVKRDPGRCLDYFQADKNFLNTLLKFNQKILKKMSKNLFYLNQLIFRTFICLYFSSKDWFPLSNIKKIPVAEILNLTQTYHTLDLNKVIEVFFLVAFEKINVKQNFQFETQMSKIDFCARLYSFKRFHVKKRLIAVNYVVEEYMKLFIEIRKFSQESRKARKGNLPSNSKKLTETVFKKININFVVIEDCWMSVSLNQIIGLHLANKTTGKYFQRLPQNDLKKLAYVIAKEELKVVPTIAEVIDLEKKRNQEYMEPIVVQYIRHADEEFDEIESFKSEISFNLDGASFNSSGFYFG